MVADFTIVRHDEQILTAERRFEQLKNIGVVLPVFNIWIEKNALIGVIEKSAILSACSKYAGSLLEGIDNMKKYNLKLVTGGKNLFKEINNYSWKERDGRFMDNEPNDAVNHLADSFRYGLESQRKMRVSQSLFRF